MTRRLILILAIAAGVLLAGVALLPWWWGGALRMIAPRLGADFAVYERIGYNRWALHDVRWQRPGVEVRAERVEAGHPLAWVLGWGRESGVIVGPWQVELTPQPAAAERSPVGYPEVHRRTRAVWRELERWLPVARVGPGSVRREDFVVAAAGGSWREGQLHVRDVTWRDQVADARLAWNPERGGPVLQVRAPESAWAIAALAAETRVQARLEWQGQVANASATFADHGWIPQTAELRAEDWVLPAFGERLGEQYRALRGDLEANWTGERGTIALTASGQPREGAVAPPLQLQIEAEGDANRLTVHALHLEAPGVRAALDRPVEISPRGSWADAPAATFRLEAALAELPFAAGRGSVTGQVVVEPQADAIPRVRGQLSVQDLSAGPFTGLQAEAGAELIWPQLRLGRLRATDANGSELALNGTADLTARRLRSAQAQGQFAAATLAPWLPEGMSVTSANLDVEAEGPLDAPHHTGRLRTGEISWRDLRPVTLELDWQGQSLQADATLVARAPTAQATVRARVGRDAASITDLQVTQGAEPVFALTGPAQVRWAPRWQVSQVRLDGPALALALELDHLGEGRLGLEAERLTLAWVEAWWSGDQPLRRAEDLRWRGVVQDGVMLFDTAGRFVLEIADGRQVQLQLTAAGRPEELVVEQFAVTADGEPIVNLSGRLPLALRPGRAPLVSAEADGEVALHAQVVPSPAFWTAVAQETGVEVERPEVTVDLTGTWAEPRGSGRIAAERIAVETARWGENWPVLSDLEARFVADGPAVALEQLHAQLEGQPVTAQARLPLDPARWTELREDPATYVRENLSGYLDLPGAEVAALARLVPDYLAPAGRLAARVELSAGGQMHGWLRLRGAVSRPLGPLGILQDIQADLAFSGREVEIRNVAARMGGQPVRLSGHAALDPQGQPRLDLKLTGTNLPLVRQTGVLLRGDLDLAVATGDQGLGRVTGMVRLTDGLFLADLQDVVPRGSAVSRPAARPPYFSVNVDPLQDWPIDVRVEGSDFLRLRTPVIESTASASFHLTGTLGEPRAVGEAILDGGRVRLPFAVFAVEEGEVRLTQADPFEPRLSLTGTSRRLGYDLRMELTGTVSDPRLQFSSSPPLASEEILLLVMAGQAPQQEVSYSGSQRAMQIGTFLGRGVIGDIFGGGGGDRLTITTGEQVSRQGRETYRFEYELTPRLSLIGEYDEFDSYNAGLRWRVLPGREDDPAAPGEETSAEEGDDGSSE